MVKVAVIGGGIFGCTIAVDLARAGAKVDLVEARSDILIGATSRCQGRLHRGYHYPRSDSTAIAARDAFFNFMERYPAAIRRLNHFYAIAPDSKTTPDEFLAFCNRIQLPYKIVDHPWQLHTAEMCVKVPEAIIDFEILRRLVRSDLAKAGVTIQVSQPMKTLHGAAEGVLVTNVLTTNSQTIKWEGKEFETSNVKASVGSLNGEKVLRVERDLDKLPL